MRTQEQINALSEKTKELMAAPSCYAGLKDAAQAWIDSLGTDKEAESAKTFVAGMEECITDIDSLIAFAGSDAAAAYFGAEKAKNLEKHGKEIKAAGAKCCDCAACAACEALLAQKDLILG